MRNILIHADDGPGMAARLESGLAIGRRHQSHLDLVISSPFQQFIATDPFGGMYLAGDQLRKAQQADQALDRRLRVELEREDVPWEVRISDGDVLATLTLAATLADLVIVSLGTADRRRSFTPPMMAGDLAMAVPAPVLAIPEPCGPIDLDAPVMVAWNGSAQSAHALRAVAHAGHRVGHAQSCKLVELLPMCSGVDQRQGHTLYARMPRKVDALALDPHAPAVRVSELRVEKHRHRRLGSGQRCPIAGKRVPRQRRHEFIKHQPDRIRPE